MASLSSARQFFEKVLVGGTPFLQSLVSAKTAETEWLDFKGADHLDDAQIRTTWSKAICGFANNQGGVLIWGIDARKDKATEIDAACGFKLSPDAAVLRSRLSQLHPTSTEPPIAGVECHAFFECGTGGQGYVVCYIPESDVKPHRAELMEGKPYMLRIGDSFNNPSPSLLRNLFFPRSSIKLGIEVEPRWEGIEIKQNMRRVDDIEIMFRVVVRNLGHVSARDIFAVIETEPVALQIEAGYKFGITKTNTDFATGIECPKPLHPTAQLDLCTIRHRVPTTTRTSTGDKLLVPSSSSLKLDVRLFATDMTPVHLRALFGDRGIAEKRHAFGFQVVESDSGQT